MKHKISRTVSWSQQKRKEKTLTRRSSWKSLFCVRRLKARTDVVSESVHRKEMSSKGCSMFDVYCCVVPNDAKKFEIFIKRSYAQVHVNKITTMKRNTSHLQMSVLHSFCISIEKVADTRGPNRMIQDVPDIAQRHIHETARTEAQVGP